MHAARGILVGWLALGGLAAVRDPGRDPGRDPSSGAALAASVQDPVDDAFFEREVRPILAARCFECHGPAARKLRGGLRLDGRAALVRGGASGPALSEEDPDASLLLLALRYGDPTLQMPPDGKLPEHELALLERWVRAGAPWPPEAAEAAEDAAAPPAEPDPEALRFFEERVRPLLAERCYECHGPDRQDVKGGLRFGSAASLARGGDSGPVIAPGRPDESRLIQAVRYFDSTLKMPPEERLAERDVELLERWVALGAPWPADASPDGDAPAGIDVAAGRTWWSFRPVTRPEPPPVRHEQLVRNPIDRFVLARLEQAGLEPGPPAAPRELVRRASFGLRGLPAALEDVRAFERDPSDAAWSALVERWLAAPEYGERWARHWLDLVRYADTNGYERDQEKPYAWRYRDWVARAFAQDLPYDRFLALQLAGDELEGQGDGLVATGFYRIGVWDDEPDDPEQALYDELDDVLRTVGDAFLGVTLACARCHDHKFDPFPQQDYYRMLAFVQGVRGYQNPSFALDSATLRPLDGGPATLARWEEERQAHVAALQAEIAATLATSRERIVDARLAALPEAERAELQAARAQPDEARDAAERERLAALVPSDAEARGALSPAESRRVEKLRNDVDIARASFEGSLDWGLAVREKGGVPGPTHVLARGRPSTPTEAVDPGFVRVLCASDAAALPELVPVDADAPSSGRRSLLASWIASPANPLTARVIVNRLWQFHFGRGLVPTPNDFGRAGEPPTHPELLDWLASELVARGWRLKELQRLILDSYAYRMSSRADDETALARDPGNALLWRQRSQRLDAEALHDALLASADGLDLGARGGPGFFPRLARGALAGGSRPGEGWGTSSPEQSARRALYAYAKRTLPVPFLEVFDLANSSLPVGQRPSTTIPSQTLTLTNGELANDAAARLAARVAQEAGAEPEARVRRAFERTLARAPRPAELAAATAYLAETARAFGERPAPLVFRPRVPDRLERRFLADLVGEDLLAGPRVGWRYLRGEWGTPYNSTKELDRARGPAALLETATVADGALTLGLELARGSAQCGILLRAEAADDFVRGVELLLDVEGGRVALVLHGETSEVLAEAPAALAAERRIDVALELDGERVRARIALAGPDAGPGASDGGGEGELLLELADARLAGAGRFGVRLVGEGLELFDVALPGADGAAHAVLADDPGPPDLRALEALCLALFNSNEFLYVD